MDIDRQKAHFFRRVSLGATLAELDSNSTPQDLLQTWLQDPQPQPAPPPRWTSPPRWDPRSSDPETRRQARQENRTRILELGSWLLQQRVEASNPLHEAITDIWRDHLVVSFKKFNLPSFVLDYDLRLRQHALGDYQTLLWSVTTSPAMLFYLDNQRNRAGQLNENYSRELMELFTLGRDHYTEADVQAGARALTGWTVDGPRLRQTGAIGSRFVPRRHDSGSKTFLGQTGLLTAEDVVEILANHPATARTVGRLLWSRLAYPDPEPAILDRLANVYQQQQRSIAAVVEAVFSSPEFYSDRAYRSQIKSPQSFVLGSIRQLQLDTNYGAILGHLRSLGHLPYTAPTVKGWPQGQGWLTSVAFLGRINLAQQMVGDYGGETGFVYDPSMTTSDLTRLLLDGDPPEPLMTQLQGLGPREATALILASPSFQVA